MLSKHISFTLQDNLTGTTEVSHGTNIQFSHLIFDIKRLILLLLDLTDLLNVSYVNKNLREIATDIIKKASVFSYIGDLPELEEKMADKFDQLGASLQQRLSLTGLRNPILTVPEYLQRLELVSDGLKAAQASIFRNIIEQKGTLLCVRDEAFKPLIRLFNQLCIIPALVILNAPNRESRQKTADILIDIMASSLKKNNLFVFFVIALAFSQIDKLEEAGYLTFSPERKQILTDAGFSNIYNKSVQVLNEHPDSVIILPPPYISRVSDFGSDEEWKTRINTSVAPKSAEPEAEGMNIVGTLFLQSLLAGSEQDEDDIKEMIYQMQKTILADFEKNMINRPDSENEEEYDSGYSSSEDASGEYEVGSSLERDDTSV